MSKTYNSTPGDDAVSSALMGWLDYCRGQATNSGKVDPLDLALKRSIGEELSPSGITAKNPYAYKLGVALAELHRRAINENTFAELGFDINLAGEFIAGRERDWSENVESTVNTGVSAGTGGLVQPGEEGGVEDAAYDAFMKLIGG